MRKINQHFFKTLGAVGLMLCIHFSACNQEDDARPDASVDWRWIGIKKNPAEPCPTVHGMQTTPDGCHAMYWQSSPGSYSPPSHPCRLEPGWNACHLFGPNDYSPSHSGRYCIYQYRGDNPDLMAMERLTETGRFLSLQPDILAVTGSGSQSLTELSWRYYENQFFTHAHKAVLQPPSVSDIKVRLAILDTSPTMSPADRPENHPGRYPHGYTLVRMARELVCNLDKNPEACLSDVSTRLVLSHTTHEPNALLSGSQDHQRGGYFGTIGDLALAVRQELDEWRQNNRRERLVINLSLAWHPKHGGMESDPARMPPAVQAVYEALEEASCEGVLVIAAAGNRIFGPDPHTGPLLPAGWERRPAPSAKTCKEKYFISHPTSNRLKGPLLFAAGGVRAYMDPQKPALLLANTPPGGAPKLLAYADHAVVESHIHDTPTSIMTGSSVSALVVSATAAAVLGYRPSLSADELMQRIHKNAHPSGLNADFCLGGTLDNPCPTPTQAKVVRFCHTLQSFCKPGREACPPEPIACFRPESTPLMGKFEAQRIQLTEIACSEKTPCPDLMYPDAQTQPWVLSQPGSIPCPPCKIRAAYGAVLDLELAPDLAGPLSHPTLVVDGRHYSIDLPSASPGTTALVSLEDIPILPESQVTLSFILAGSNSVSSPVYIHP